LQFCVPGKLGKHVCVLSHPLADPFDVGQNTALAGIVVGLSQQRWPAWIRRRFR
jgi:hypothetical protein